MHGLGTPTMPETPKTDEPPVPRPRSFGKLNPEAEHRGRFGPYILEPGLCNAANTALLLGRPLLLTGEPGCGKTDFAWVAANALGFRPESEPEPLQCHVRSEMAARDLLYHYDALLRFVDSHHPREDVRAQTTGLSRYFELRGLGQALAWPRDERPVLLIDEIDKAPRDLPNDLLRALDVGEFEVAELHDGDEVELGDFTLQRRMGRGQSKQRTPFVVITSNVEQQLPEPFLRRCVFFHIGFPERDRLLEIVRRRPPVDAGGQPLSMPQPLVDAAVDIFLTLRDVKDLGKKPATSELLDWTTTLAQYWDPATLEPWLLGFKARIAHDKKKDVRTLSPRESFMWRNLPGLECLLKLRDDRERVGATG